MTAVGAFVPKPVNVGPDQKHGTDPAAEALRLKIIDLMTSASSNAPRSLQRAIGPSEIGHPCARKIAFKVAGVEETPNWQDPMPSILGVAFHAWMEEVLPRGEWLAERRVNVAPGLDGSSDAYHIPTRTVVDWKLLGATQHQQYVNGYMSDQYRVQGHAYGQGYVNAGYPVDRVAIAIFCRAKPLHNLFVWSEPWRPDLAQEAVNRLARIRMYVAASGASDANRAPLLQINATAGDTCFFCRYKGTSDQGLCDRSR